MAFECSIRAKGSAGAPAGGVAIPRTEDVLKVWDLSDELGRILRDTQSEQVTTSLRVSGEYLRPVVLVHKTIGFCPLQKSRLNTFEAAMPRYLRTSDVPAIFADLQGNPEAVFQLDAWQRRWVVEMPQVQSGAAVLSYRWRNRASRETLDTFFTWLEVCPILHNSVEEPATERDGLHPG